MKVLILIRKWYDSRLKYSFMTILWLVLDSKFALRKYFDYSHTLSDFSLNINFSIWLQLTLKPSWFIKVYNVWLFLTIADYFWLFLTFMRKFLTQNLSLAEVIFWILGGYCNCNLDLRYIFKVTSPTLPKWTGVTIPPLEAVSFWTTHFTVYAKCWQGFTAPFRRST